MKLYQRIIQGKAFKFKAFDCKGIYLYVICHDEVEFILMVSRALSGIISPVPDWIKDLEDELEEATIGME